MTNDASFVYFFLFSILTLFLTLFVKLIDFFEFILKVLKNFCDGIKEPGGIKFVASNFFIFLTLFFLFINFKAWNEVAFFKVNN